jgi:hypothetical protein
MIARAAVLQETEPEIIPGGIPMAFVRHARI